jgi:hypothetical protein
MLLTPFLILQLLRFTKLDYFYPQKYLSPLILYTYRPPKIPDKIIQNMDVPSCKNCVYFKPSSFIEFTSHYNNCHKFGVKNIISDKITYDYVETCRKDESKCGYIGKAFKKAKFIRIKIMTHAFINNLPKLYILLLVSLYFYKISLSFKL